MAIVLRYRRRSDRLHAVVQGVFMALVWGACGVFVGAVWYGVLHVLAMGLRACGVRITGI